MNTNYIELLRKFMKKQNKANTVDNDLFTQIYDDLYESLSLEQISKLNNMFILLTGISLDTLFQSEDLEGLLEGNYKECLEFM